MDQLLQLSIEGDVTLCHKTFIQRKLGSVSWCFCSKWPEGQRGGQITSAGAVAVGKAMAGPKIVNATQIRRFIVLKQHDLLFKLKRQEQLSVPSHTSVYVFHGWYGCLGNILCWGEHLTQPLRYHEP